MKFSIEDLGIHGEGIARGEGKVLFIDGALPLEEVEAEIVQEKKNYAVGKLKTICRRSPERVEPSCPFFTECGGCQVMHLSYEGQLKIKRDRVVQALKRIGKISDVEVEPCLRSDENLGYRNKLIVPTVWQRGERRIGFFKKGSHEVVDISFCQINLGWADELFQQVREILLRSKVSFFDEKRGKGELRHLIFRSSHFEQKLLIGFMGRTEASHELKEVMEEVSKLDRVKGIVWGINGRKDNVIYPDRESVIHGEGVLEERLCGVEATLSLFSFFQVNRMQAEKMYQLALEMAQVEKGAKVIDTYCGVGIFAIYMAKEGICVEGIESYAPAVENAKENSRRNGVDVTFTCGKVEEELMRLEGQDVIFINPPRKGCDPKVIEACKAERIIYTSCDPATLARDVALFVERGYEVDRVCPVDMFPQTMHVECVLSLVKKSCNKY